MRDPRHPAWPRFGERTELRDVAERWKWAYVDWCLTRHRKRVLGHPEDQTLGPALERYMQHRSRVVEAETFASDRSAFTHLTAMYPADTPVERIEVQPIVDRLLVELYKPSSLVTYAAHIASFIQWCGLPAPRYEIPDPGSGDVQTLSDGQIEAVRASAGNGLVAIDLGIYMGLRKSEIFAIEGSDINTREWSVRVQRQMPKAGKVPKPLKGKRARTALILPGWTHGNGVGRLVAPTPQLQRAELITHALERAGVYRLGMGWHVLRHTYARLVLEGGGSLEQLKVFLGHKNIRTTEDTYGHFSPDVAVRLAREKLHRR